MFRSKYMKITAIVIGLIVLSGVGFYVFSQRNNIGQTTIAQLGDKFNCNIYKKFSNRML